MQASLDSLETQLSSAKSIRNTFITMQLESEIASLSSGFRKQYNPVRTYKDPYDNCKGPLSPDLEEYMLFPLYYMPEDEIFPK